MINSGYFTSRNEILQWLTQLLGLQVTLIEQLGSGSLYCQVLDAAYSNKVPLQKVKWNAISEVDFLHNFRILQNAFERLGISRVIQTQKLVKAKYQDNLEFIQWMKWYLGPLIVQNPHYDAVARRGQASVQLLGIKKNLKEDKENMGRSAGGLKSYGSVHNLKPIERTLEKGQSLRALNVEENKQKENSTKQKHSIGKTSRPLKEKYISSVTVIESEEEECF